MVVVATRLWYPGNVGKNQFLLDTQGNILGDNRSLDSHFWRRLIFCVCHNLSGTWVASHFLPASESVNDFVNFGCDWHSQQLLGSAATKRLRNAVLMVSLVKHAQASTYRTRRSHTVLHTSSLNSYPLDDANTSTGGRKRIQHEYSDHVGHSAWTPSSIWHSSVCFVACSPANRPPLWPASASTT